jgi:hypothetical protein
MKKAKEEIDNETSLLTGKEEITYNVDNTEMPEKNRLFSLI